MFQKKILLLLFLTTIPYLTKGQKISNVTAEIRKVNRQIVVYYDLKATDSRFDRYVVSLYLSTDGGKTFQDSPLDYTAKNVGRGVAPGTSNEILWSYLQSDLNFSGKNVAFKVKAELDLQARWDRLSELKGAEGCFYSMLFPGWGNQKVRSGRTPWWIGAVSYAMLGAGTYLHFKSRDNFKSYENATSISQGDIFLNNSQNQNTASQALLIGGAVIWLSDVIQVLFKGAKNKKDYWNLYFQREEKKSQLGFHGIYDSRLGNTGLAIRYSF